MIQLTVSDLASEGFGGTWQQTRTYCNQLSTNADLGLGFNWLGAYWPNLVSGSGGSITLVRGVNGSLWFDPSGSSYVGRYGTLVTLTHDIVNNVFVATYIDGVQQQFWDFTQTAHPAGAFKQEIAAGGAVTQVISYTSSGRIAEIQRSGTVSGVTVTESYLYSFDINNRLTNVLLRRQSGGGAWQSVRQVVYDYHPGTDSFGSVGDLRTARVQVLTSGSWTDSAVSYYRYYVSGEANGFVHGLKYVVQPSTYNKMLAAGVNPLTATNAVVSTYADYYFQYDSQQRVTQEQVDGASRTFSFAYTAGTPASTDYNVWATKTVETQPDGNLRIVYTNFLGQPLIDELRSGTSRWIHAYHQDSQGHAVWHAYPSAVISYDDTQQNLAIQLQASSGLIEWTDYYTTTGSGAAAGYIADTKLSQGSTGTPVMLRAYQYTSQSAGGVTVYPVSQETVYQNADGTGAVTTSYSYAFYAGTTQVQQRTITFPVVPNSQNGTGVADSRKDYFDTSGRLTWGMDERGFITRSSYDLSTGATTQQVNDVNTTLYSDTPSGWSTPTGGGLNLISDYTVDDQGRMTQSLGPSHTIDISGTATVVRRAGWAVYDDTNYITYTGAGYATGTSPSYTYTLINPVNIAKRDADGKLLEQIQAAAASTSGSLAQIITAAGSGAAAFPQSSYTAWTTIQYLDCCLTASMRVYKLIPATGTGVSGTNYNETDYGYDLMKRRNRTVTPGGTITDIVYDPRGLVLGSYVGTNDAGATANDPTGGHSDPNNNMVIVTGNVYDGGNAGGDGNLTQQTQYVDNSTTRVNTFLYDWRDRQTDVAGPVNYYAKTYYDNLDRVIKLERYNTTASGNLIARSIANYDNRGRVYQSVVYAVDPNTGTVGNALTENTWYDQSGHKLESRPAGSNLYTKSVYDSLGRATIQYRGYEPTAGSPNSVSTDVVLEQSETAYDAASNAIQSTSRQRYHNAPTTQLGALGDPSTTPNARVVYTASYPDALGRGQASADYGTNGGTALSRSSTIPTRSDTCLVTGTVFDNAGRVYQTTDPKGLLTQITYDAVGRETARVQNPNGPSGGSGSNPYSCTASNDVAVTVQRTYNADGNLAALTAVNAVTGNQTTTYTYGTTLAASAIASSLLKVLETYPDSVSGSDVITFTYNRQGQTTSVTDQNGTVHQYVYDGLGRQTQDCVTTLGTGVDGAIRRIATTYEVRGMKTGLTSYDNPTVGSGNVVNDVQFAYNTFSQLISDAQEHGGAVGGSTPKVQYGYANGSTNTIRPTTVTYPNGRVITYNYGTTGGVGDQLSRVVSIIDQDGTHLADYSYLGT